MPRLIGERATSRRRAGVGARLRVTVGLVVAGWVLAGCSLVGQGCGSTLGTPACTHAPTGPPGGMSKDAAIAAARRLAPAAGAELAVVWAAVEHDPFAPQGDVRWAWMVRLTGVFAAPPCPTQDPDAASRPNASVACVDGDGGLDVVLDYYTGAFVGWTN